MSRFSLFTDANVDGRLVRGLRQRGWDLHRAVDAFAQDEDDDVLFEHAVKNNLVFVTNDEDFLTLTASWLEENGSFRMIYWEKKRHDQVSIGTFLDEFEKLAEEDDPFRYSIRFLNP